MDCDSFPLQCIRKGHLYLGAQIKVIGGIKIKRNLQYNPISKSSCRLIEDVFQIIAISWIIDDD